MHPDKRKEMQATFLTEAVKYNVLPLDDRVYERFNPAVAGRPDLMGKRTSLTVYEGMVGMKENASSTPKIAHTPSLIGPSHNRPTARYATLYEFIAQMEEGSSKRITSTMARSLSV